GCGHVRPLAACSPAPARGSRAAAPRGRLLSRATGSDEPDGPTAPAHAPPPPPSASPPSAAPPRPTASTAPHSSAPSLFMPEEADRIADRLREDRIVGPRQPVGHRLDAGLVAALRVSPPWALYELPYCRSASRR